MIDLHYAPTPNGWKVTIMGGNGFNSPAYIKNAGPAAEGTYVGTAWNKVSADAANQGFLAVMKARNIDPDQFCAQSYTGDVAIDNGRISSVGGKAGRGHREIDANGLLVPPKNSQALADALEKLITSPDLRDQMGKSGRQFALEKFSLDKIIQQTLTIYPKLF